VLLRRDPLTVAVYRVTAHDEHRRVLLLQGRCAILRAAKRLRRFALVLTAIAALAGCASGPSPVRWLPASAHGTRPDLPTAGGGGNDRLLFVRDGRTVASVPTEPGRGGVVHLPND
jgi:hypothetical protein